MSLTVLGEHETTIEARTRGDRVWIGPDDLEDAIGWVRKPEGLCRGAVCVPVRQPIEDGAGSIDLAAAARALGKQLVFDPAGPVAAVADDPMARGEIRGLHELSLPDVDGRMVDLSGFAGKKVVLLAWASW